MKPETIVNSEITEDYLAEYGKYVGLGDGEIIPCAKCGQEFKYEKLAHSMDPCELIRCVECGDAKRINFYDESPVYKAIERITDDYDHVIGDHLYRALLELNLKPCKCGGRYRFIADYFCPKHISKKKRRQEYAMMFDEKSALVKKSKDIYRKHPILSFEIARLINKKFDDYYEKITPPHPKLP